MELLLIFFSLVLVADICGIYQLVEIAKKKGHYRNGAGVLWFIGIFGTLFMVGFVVAALPDWSGKSGAGTANSSNDHDALPEV